MGTRRREIHTKPCGKLMVLCRNELIVAEPKKWNKIVGQLILSASVS